MWRRWTAVVLGVVVAALAGVACSPSRSGDQATRSGSASSSPGPYSTRKAGDEIDLVLVDGAPLSVKAAFGSLWVATDHGKLERIDPSTEQVIATVPVGAFPVGIAAGFGSLWQVSHDDGTLTRVDPANNQVIATIPVGPGPAQVEVATAWCGSPMGGRR
jgi:YVTN family beta-propeller protein